MAQMPIQMVAGRANPYIGESPPPAPRATRHPGTYHIDTGGISGGTLRPGAMDQARFKAMLATAQKSSAGAPMEPATPPAASAAAPRIPTLTPAQLAALGLVEEPQVATPAPAATPAPTATPAPAGEAASTEPASAAKPAAGPVAAESVTAKPTPDRPMPRARMGADGVWEFPRLPTKDEREMLYGQKWRLVEDPDATRLFLGEDGKFGWDDFVDLINPLQHIPLVNIAYRAITGDEINGAARMIDFAFGPIAGVSTAADLAFRDIAGDSMAGTAVAALFGGDTGDDALSEYTTASSGRDGVVQIADAGRRGSHR